jgi:hypothetical protein
MGKSFGDIEIGEEIVMLVVSSLNGLLMMFDERYLKIARQKKKNGKLKNEVCVLKNELLSTQKWLKISTGFGCLCFGINLVLVTIILYSGRLISNPSMYLRG